MKRRSMTITRSMWQMMKTFRRTRRLVRRERRLPLEDRRPFIVRCAFSGRLTVEYFETVEEYQPIFDNAQDEPFVTWCTGYDPYKDVNR